MLFRIEASEQRKEFIYWMYILRSGERQFMLYNKDENSNERRFGKLELVDREIFFISFNTRDN